MMFSWLTDWDPRGRIYTWARRPCDDDACRDDCQRSRQVCERESWATRVQYSPTSIVSWCHRSWCIRSRSCTHRWTRHRVMALAWAHLFRYCRAWDQRTTGRRRHSLLMVVVYASFSIYPQHPKLRLWQHRRLTYSSSLYSQPFLFLIKNNKF